MLEILMNSNKSKIIFWSFLVFELAACQNDDGPSEREIALEYLTNNSEKRWVVDNSNIDGKPITLNLCDSSYNLIMKADFTWKEIYLNLQCNPPGGGQWSLNEENNVISIVYINPGTGKREEAHFEIEELSEDFFAYQFAENNRMKYVRLKRGQ